jgi:hypothetical protein
MSAFLNSARYLGQAQYFGAVSTSSHIYVMVPTFTHIFVQNTGL